MHDNASNTLVDPVTHYSLPAPEFTTRGQSSAPDLLLFLAGFGVQAHSVVSHFSCHTSLSDFLAAQFYLSITLKTCLSGRASLVFLSRLSTTYPEQGLS